MHSHISRKSFLNGSLLGALGLLVGPGIVSAFQKREKGPQLDKELVKEFVAVAHKDETKTKDMLAANPDLLNSVHNLGSWDWEDALGAAGHVGNPSLAEFLLAQGARPTICVFAMLGKTDIVKAMITAYPQMKAAKGPHEISLLRHALAGGASSEETVAYLKSIGCQE